MFYHLPSIGPYENLGKANNNSAQTLTTEQAREQYLKKSEITE